MQFGGGGGLLFFFSFFLLSLCCTVVFALLVSGSTVYSKISSNFGIMYLPFYKQCPSVTRKSQNHGRNTFYSWYHTVILSYVSIPYNNSLKTFCKIVYFLLQDFRVERFRWTRALCNHDSDGDGISNGAELGDPDCTWRVGQAILQSAIGHPGIVFYPMWGMGKCIPIYYVATITCSG